MAGAGAKGSDAAQEVVTITVDLPAPADWKKKFTPKKGGTPRRNEIFFISPTGEVIKSKRHLEQYLRANPGNPPLSEFDWGSGDTPRRSTRISEKTKAIETPEGEKPNKRERKSSSKKGAKERKDTGDDEADIPQKEEGKVSTDVEMKEADNVTEKAKELGEVAAEQDSVDISKENVEEKTVEPVEKKEVPEEASKAIQDASVPVTKKRTRKQNKWKRKQRKKEDKLEKEEDKSEKETPESRVVLPLTSVHKEEVPAEKEINDGEVLSENGGHKTDQEGAISKEVLSENTDDGQHQPKAPAVNC